MNFLHIGLAELIYYGEKNKMAMRFCPNCSSLLRLLQGRSRSDIQFECPKCELFFPDESSLSKGSIPEIKSIVLEPFPPKIPQVKGSGAKGEKVESIIPSWRKDGSVTTPMHDENRVQIDKGMLNSLFPYSNIREGQRQFMDHCKLAFKRGMNLAAYAPTGIGKTVASLVPAIEEGLKQGKTILFLTSKQSQHKMAIDTIRRIVGASPNHLNKLIKRSPNRSHIRENSRSKGHTLIAVDIISKQDMCPRDFASEHHAVFNEFCKMEKKTRTCPYLKSENLHVYGTIEEGILHVEELAQLAKSAMMCPHAAALEVARYAHVIICDYNYLFSDISERMLEKLNLVHDDILAILDEAHNLPDRIRNHMKGDITLNRFSDALSELQEEDQQLYRYVRDIRKKVADMFSDMKENDEEKLSKNDFIHKVQSILDSTLDRKLTFEGLYKRLIEIGEKRIEEKHTSSSLLVIGEFFKVWASDITGTIRFASTKGSEMISYRLLDPSIISRSIFNKLHSSVLMSGTLFPPRTYADMLGLTPGRTVLKEYKSPFPLENRKVFVLKEVSTLYKERTPKMFSLITDNIYQASESFSGNVAVFFPSYHLLQDIAFELAERGPSKQLIVEEKGMDKVEKERMFKRLSRLQYMGGGILLGVQGGSLSEGVDYPGDLLQMVIVVGVPLAPPSIEVKHLISYYRQLFGVSKGYMYSYIYPALSRVLQSAGRCIRDENDRGVVVLMDRRFAKSQYGKHFPIDFNLEFSTDYISKIKDFFKSANE